MAKDLLRQTRDYFKAQGIAEVDASILLEHLLQCSRSEVQLKLLRMSNEEVDEVDRNLRRLVLRRQNAEPVQYITGKAPFRYLEYNVGPGVLIPRPETETLVSIVLEALKDQSESSVVDLGSGSGCIAISLATERGGLKVTAVENSAQALVWLRKNVDELAPLISVVEAAVQTACPGQLFDLVVANPPYIPMGEALPIEVRKEPFEALSGGSLDGTLIPEQFIRAAIRLLKNGGLLAMEHHESQASAISHLLTSEFGEIATINDLNGRPRFTTARKN